MSRRREIAMAKPRIDECDDGSDGYCVYTHDGVYYGGLTQSEATRLCEYMENTGAWAYDDVADYMGWPK